MLHRGSETVSHSELEDVRTPEATATWTPVPHTTLVSLVTSAIEAAGLEVTSRDFAIWRGGERFFGLMTIGGGEAHDYATTIGLRNSHDFSLPAALAIGSRVFVCDNLSFSSEVVIKTRHTSRVMERLPRVVEAGIASLIDVRKSQDKRISLYKTCPVRSPAHLHDMSLRLYRSGAIPARGIVRVIDEFEKPKHDEFRDWNLWSLMNATTETLKEFGDIQPRTQRMHGVLDMEIAEKLLA
jgi:hypothetical protein